MDEVLNRADLVLLRHTLREAGGDLGGNARRAEDAEVVLERIRLGEVAHNELNDLLDVLLRCVDDRVGAGIVGVAGLEVAGRLDREAVVLGDDGDDGARDVVHVRDRGVGVKRDGVELVGVLHGDLRKGVEVAGADRIRNLRHAAGHGLLDAVLEELGGLNGALHARGRRRRLLHIGDNADERVDVRPVRLRRDLDRERVGAVCLDTLLPGDVAAEEGAARRARALTRNDGEVGGVGGELVESGQGGNKGRETSRGRRKTSCGREVVLRGDMDLEARDLIARI